jgi:hypothetical protein
MRAAVAGSSSMSSATTNSDLSFLGSGFLGSSGFFSKSATTLWSWEIIKDRHANPDKTISAPVTAMAQPLLAEIASKPVNFDLLKEIKEKPITYSEMVFGPYLCLDVN